MSFNLFGFTFGKQAEEEKNDATIDGSVVAPQNDDGAGVYQGSYGGVYGYSLNIDTNFNDEFERIIKYREISSYPPVKKAITAIVNTAITGDSDDSPVSISLDKLEVSDGLKDKITQEFDTIKKHLNFNKEAFEIFTRWYIDGRLYYNVIIDSDKPKEGIKELRFISPLHIKKIREEKTKTLAGVTTIVGYEEYYLYSREIRNLKAPFPGTVRLTNDSVIFTHSGLLDDDKGQIKSWLDDAIRPTNMLRMEEDALIIYRLSRAPERRVFYVDVGNLPKTQAESYLQNLQKRYKNRMIYDSSTGQVKDQKHHQTMLEDFWMPRRDGTKGTEVTTLPGGQSLGEIQDIEYFKNNLYEALNVPIGRLKTDQPQMLGIGRPSETTREEMEFKKFVERLQKRFEQLFYQLLRTQLLLKHIISEDDWETLAENIGFSFATDMFFSELREGEVLRERITTYQMALPLRGIAYSNDFLRKEILKQTEEEIKEQDKKIEEERKDLISKQPNADPNSLIPQPMGPEVGVSGAPQDPFGQPPFTGPSAGGNTF